VKLPMFELSSSIRSHIDNPVITVSIAVFSFFAYFHGKTEETMPENIESIMEKNGIF